MRAYAALKRNKNLSPSGSDTLFISPLSSSAPPLNHRRWFPHMHPLFPVFFVLFRCEPVMRNAPGNFRQSSSFIGANNEKGRGVARRFLYRLRAAPSCFVTGKADLVNTLTLFSTHVPRFSYLWAIKRREVCVICFSFFVGVRRPSFEIFVSELSALTEWSWSRS